MGVNAKILAASCFYLVPPNSSSGCSSIFRLPDLNHRRTLRAANHDAGLEPAEVVFELVAAFGAFDESGALGGRFFGIFVGFHVLSS